MLMRESFLENKLSAAVGQRAGLCLKFLSSTSGWPDRLVLLPGGKLAFVELKAPGEHPRPLQLRRHDQLRALGFPVFVLDDPSQIGPFLDSL